MNQINSNESIESIHPILSPPSNSIFDYEDIIFHIFSFLQFADIVEFTKTCSLTLSIGVPLIQKLYKTNLLFKKWIDVHYCLLKEEESKRFSDEELTNSVLFSQDFDPELGLYIFLIYKDNIFRVVVRTIFRTNYCLMVSDFQKIRESHYSFKNELLVVHFTNSCGDSTVLIKISHKKPHLSQYCKIFKSSEPVNKDKNLYHYDKLLCFECRDNTNISFALPELHKSKPSTIGWVNFGKWIKSSFQQNEKNFVGLYNDGSFIFEIWNNDFTASYEKFSSKHKFPEFFALVDNFRPIESFGFLCVPTNDNRWIRVQFLKKKVDFINHKDYPVFSFGELYLIDRNPLSFLKP